MSSAESFARNPGEPGSGEAAHGREVKIVADLERLPGVISAAVWLDAQGTLRDVRITASPVTPALIVANAASAVLGRHGLPFRPDDIHVDHVRPTQGAPAAPGEAAEPQQAGGRFIVLHELSISRSMGRVTVSTQLSCRGQLFHGEASELDTEPGRIRAAVRATLAAAQRISDGPSLGLEASAALDVFGRRFVAVSIEATAGRRFTTLNGFVGFDIQRSAEEAAILATLRAIERWIAW